MDSRKTSLYWDRQRTIHYPILAIQFVVCVGCWVLVVTALGGKISTPGMTASVITGFVLVGVTWLLAKFGVPPQHGARPAARAGTTTAAQSRSRQDA